MRKRLLTVLVTMALLVASVLAPATWADSHGELTGIQWQWAELTETEPARCQRSWWTETESSRRGRSWRRRSATRAPR